MVVFRELMYETVRGPLAITGNIAATMYLYFVLESRRI